MSTPEFKILIDDESVKGEYGLPSSQPDSVAESQLVRDQLALDTVGLMNRWLSFWDLIEDLIEIDRSGIRRMEHLLQPSTLQVLGRQLWQLILANEVGEALKEKVPKEGEPPIRLSIEFEEKADPTLKGLPWEFLFEPQNEWFLATKTELLLTRYVSTRQDRAKVTQVSDRETLRTLLIAALPGSDKFAPHREALWNLRAALKDVKNLEVAEPIKAWDPKVIADTLKTGRYHIVHVVGICRGAPGNPEIYLGGDGFQEPAQFVNSLTPDEWRPRLVILQLCDYEDGDATENFERLAPALIRRQVPAVLALQYAARVGQADHIGLGKQFYQSLVGGKHIGAAVQASRRRLIDEHPDRRFGTPVLYLQEDGALRRPGAGSGAGVFDSPGRGTSGGQTDRGRWIVQLEKRKRVKDDELLPFLMWLGKQEAELGLAELKILAREQMLAQLDPASQKVFTEAYLALGELEHGDG
jgi:hypothetical protein